MPRHQKQRRSLHCVVYRYIREVEGSRFPTLKSLEVSRFREQLDWLQEGFHIATVAEALAFLAGDFKPSRDLCLLSFDDTLREHYQVVAPMLIERGLSGMFGVITGCAGQQWVAPVHMNHFLTAELGLAQYAREFLSALRAKHVRETEQWLSFDPRLASRTYPLETAADAAFLYLRNIALPEPVRNEVLTHLFEQHFGSVPDFAAELYLGWREIIVLQAAGMHVAGQGDSARPLSSHPAAALADEVDACRTKLTLCVAPQELWPFTVLECEPEPLSENVVQNLQRQGFACAFGLQAGANAPGTAPFHLRRYESDNVEAALDAFATRGTQAGQ